MKPLRPQLRGLVFKLALFYVLLSLPCLIVVETGILVYEFDRFMAAVDAGALAQATQSAAAELNQSWPAANANEAQQLATWTEARMLRLQRPHGGLLEEESFILFELASDPLGVAVLAPDGHPLAEAPVRAGWQMQLPAPQSAEWNATLAGSSAQMLSGSDDPYRIRRALAPLRDNDGALRGMLLIELRLPVPWHRFLLDLSLEWPIVLGYLVLFGLASSFFLATWVTRRLNRVARAASAWSRGDFSDRIDDRSSDELGLLSAQLDNMALELKALMRSRAQLATLAERQRLARDLHDTVKQKAFALNLQLATVRRQLGPHAAAERLAQAERLSQQIQQELVHILDELRDSDSALPFVERLRIRAVEWAQVSGIALDLDLHELPSLPALHEEALLRIADEALANVLRHSGATQARVSLHRADDSVALQIVDNGRGVQDSAQSGMGLGNMRERALSLPDGRFDFSSTGASGTRVSITFSITGVTTA
jgi:signal transduction histidine kinase